MITIRVAIRQELNIIKSYVNSPIFTNRNAVNEHLKNIEYLLNNFTDIGEKIEVDELERLLTTKPIKK